MVRTLMEAVAGMQGKGTRIERKVAIELSRLAVVYEQQKVFDRAVADFYLPESNAIIECDGAYWHSMPHVVSKDQRRDGWLRSLGLIVVRLGEAEINTDAEVAVRKALRAIKHVQGNLQNRERAGSRGIAA